MQNNYKKQIENAKKSLDAIIHETPLEFNTTFSEISGNQIFLKLENLQKTGSFKIRGAFNKITKLSDGERKNGVIAASAGNHGQGVALAAKKLNIRATIVVPKGTPIIKIQAIKRYEAEVIEFGRNFDEAYQKAREIQKKKGMTFIEPFNDEDIIIGQGTIGLEIMKQLSDVDLIVVPIGGGGLISGISLYCKAVNPRVKIIGVQAEGSKTVYNSFKKGKLEIIKTSDTIAEGIAVKRPGTITFDIIKEYVDDVVIVSDEEIANAILMCMERAKLIVEGAGAAPLAAILNNKISVKNKKIVLVLSGGNIDVNLINKIILKGLIKAGRLLKFNTIIKDIPGTLYHLLELIAEEGGNIISIIHDRSKADLLFKEAEIEIKLETRDHSHISKILKKLKDHKYNIILED
ncbi:MAG: threonine ammonia-lyase [Candidatus Helarchaeota archaeon]